MSVEDADETDSKAMQFKVLKASTATGARLGRLAINSRNTVNTPHYVGLTSRGVIPHISQDVMQKHTRIKGVYIALEDFIERAALGQTPPILSPTRNKGSSALRSFVSMPEEQLIILGSRRVPPVVAPWSNTQTAISISTSFGFGKLKAQDYASAARALDPDIVVGLGDIPYGERAGQRRIERMGWRTERWLQTLFDEADARDEQENYHSLAGKVFAPILPVSKEAQSLYLDMISREWRSKISGLAVYDTNVLAQLPESLLSAPKLSMSGVKKPMELLREISLGMDILTVPFLSEATDSGVALDFTFPARLEEENSETQCKPLGIDMLASQHATALSPLVSGCDCYACSVHHRAYVHHLLSTNEMLAWVLLQIHNTRVIDGFFEGIRASITKGTFGQDYDTFLRAYEQELPQTKAQGPRVRGYQLKSEGPGESKKNPKAYHTLDSAKEVNADSSELPGPKAKAEDLKTLGFAEVANPKQ